ncbi:hypothetical protein LY76DRAFT_585834 [Colletotrichum caudatum]|nr:hypothetical protein LY76DRAFT_585834 [Colletotrichum caudatum]
MEEPSNNVWMKHLSLCIMIMTMRPFLVGAARNGRRKAETPRHRPPARPSIEKEKKKIKINETVIEKAKMPKILSTPLVSCPLYRCTPPSASHSHQQLALILSRRASRRRQRTRAVLHHHQLTLPLHCFVSHSVRSRGRHPEDKALRAETALPAGGAMGAQWPHEQKEEKKERKKDPFTKNSPLWTRRYRPILSGMGNLASEMGMVCMSMGPVKR